MDIDGNISSVNRGALELLGYNSINLIGESILNFTPTASGKDFKDVFKELLSEGTLKDRKIQLYDVKGQLRNLKASFTLLKDTKERPIGIISIFTDIKELAALEKEILELQEFSQNIVENAGVGIVATDLKGKIIFASKGTRNIFKKASNRLKGENIIKNLGDPIALNEKFTSLVDKGKSFEYELDVKDGNIGESFLTVFTPLRDGVGKVSGTIVVFKNISKLKEVEEQLKESNSILKNYSLDLERLVDTTRTLGAQLDAKKIYKTLSEVIRKTIDSDVIFFLKYSEKGFTLDFSDGIKAKSLKKEISKKEFQRFLSTIKDSRIVSPVNKEKSFPPRVVDKNFTSSVFIPLYAKNEIFGLIALFFKGERRFMRKELEFLQSLGSSTVMALENARLYGEIREFANELEEKVKERTKDLSIANEELEQSNRLKDLFIDIMRHDLLNPIMIARNTTELVMESEKDPTLKNFLTKVHKINDRTIKMIENASTLARLESGSNIEFDLADLGTVISNAVEDLSNLAEERNIKIKTNLKGEFPALVNPLIYDVFSNLISNAIKYGTDNTDIAVGIVENGSKWRVSVADRGEGIADEHKKAVFERFTRVQKGAVKGSGLGLAIVKKVVDAHSGKVWVEDNPGGGSIFNVVIPKA